MEPKDRPRYHALDHKMGMPDQLGNFWVYVTFDGDTRTLDTLAGYTGDPIPLATEDSPSFEGDAVPEDPPAVQPRFRLAPDDRLDIEGAWTGTDGVPSWHLPDDWIPDFRKQIVICDDARNIKVVEVQGINDSDPGAVTPYAAGTVGPTGSTGAAGTDGATAYEIAVAHGFIGSEADWLASLKGYADFQSETPTGTVNGSNHVFTLSTTPSGGTLVFVNGLLQTEGVDYTISGTTVTFTTAPAGGSTIEAVVSVIATGPAGPAGADGASAYDVAVANGFVGTEADWLATLVGPSGATGELPRTLNLVIDGGGSDITTGIKADVFVPVDCTIGQWTLMADAAGDIEIDIWADDLSVFPPTGGDSICGSSLPALSSADNSLGIPDGTWSPDLVNGEVLRFNVNSCSGITRVTLALSVQRTA